MKKKENNLSDDELNQVTGGGTGETGPCAEASKSDCDRYDNCSWSKHDYCEYAGFSDTRF